MEDIIIEATDLCCQSGKRYLLKDINWQVKRGQHWIVFGMNGSGKTTLLSIIAGFKKYTGGDLKIFGQPYTNDNILSLRRRIGFVSSSFFDRYYGKESALEIVLSGKIGALGLNNHVTDYDVRQAKALLEELHVAHKTYHPFAMLSKGERQNVLIARALMLPPEILVLDEPCTGLDILARDHLQNTIDELARKTTITIIYVTHYTEEILPIMDHGMLLSHGHAWAQGDIEAMFTEERMSQFLGYPVQMTRDDQGRKYCHANVHSQVYQLLGGEQQ